MRMGAPSTRRFAASLDPSSPSQQNQLARSAASAGAATMTSRVFGLVRDQVVASIFGAGDAMDAFNIGTILCALLLVPLMPRFGWPPIMAIAIGALAGGVAQLALQWPLLRREGFSYAPLLNWKQDGLRRVLMLMGPGTLGLAATQ